MAIVIIMGKLLIVTNLNPDLSFLTQRLTVQQLWLSPIEKFQMQDCHSDLKFLLTVSYI